jgi:hypothetical protein
MGADLEDPDARERLSRRHETYTRSNKGRSAPASGTRVTEVPACLARRRGRLFSAVIAGTREMLAEGYRGMYGCSHEDGGTDNG